MLLGLPQTPLVGLAVHGDEHLADIGQHPDRSRTPADVGARPAGHRDAAGQHEFVVAVSAGLGHPLAGRMLRRDLHDPLDHAGVGTRSHHSGVAASAEQQPEPRDDHRLAGARLTGEHVEARSQVDRDVVDHAEVADSDAGQHARQPMPQG